jgi:hypothetical protein
MKTIIWPGGTWYVYALGAKGAFASAVIHSGIEWMEFCGRYRNRYSRVFMRQLKG